MTPETKAMLAAIVRKYYEPITDLKDVNGSQIVDCEWLAPRWGCDTLDNLIADLGEAIDERQAKLETAIPAHELAALCSIWREHASKREGDFWISLESCAMDLNRLLDSYERKAEISRVSKLETAIRETLAENAHLADGDNCTLRKLKDALKD
jgi:hypothetical protein